MKKIIYVTLCLTLSILMLLVLVACSAPEKSSALQDASVVIAPVAMQLALGTFALEKTDYPVGAKQAGELLPLWKAARSLGESETTAATELEAVIAQIQSTMTSEQVQSITDMQLTIQDMNEIAQELGLEIGTGGGHFGNIDPGMQATVQAARNSGQMPSGMGPEGGFGDGPGGGADLDPAARETTMAERGGAPGANLGLNPALLDAVIEFLYAKTQ